MSYNPEDPNDPFNRALRNADISVALACFGMVAIPLTEWLLYLLS